MNSQLEARAASSSSLLEQQRLAYQLAPYTSAEERTAKLKTLKTLKKVLLNHQNDFIGALQEDFGTRAKEETLMLEILPCVNMINCTTCLFEKLRQTGPKKIHGLA